MWLGLGGSIFLFLEFCIYYVLLQNKYDPLIGISRTIENHFITNLLCMQRYCRMKSEERDLSNKLCPATLIGNAATFTK